MASHRPRIRLPAVALAAIMGASSAIGGGYNVGTAQTASPPGAPAVDAVDLRLPDDAALTFDAERTVIDVPEPPGDIDAGVVDAVIGGTYAAAEALPLAEWDIAALAANLGGDPRAAFEFVRDSIRLDPYRGVLRGADGTLAARSGNSSDRALLLHELLSSMGATSRYAFGDVTPEAAALLVDHAFDDAVASLPDAGDLRLASLDGAAIEQRSRRDYALLREALGDRLGAMAPTSLQGALMDVVHHTWVQVEEDGVWVDYDPSLADAQPRTALAVAFRTSETMPPEEHQALTIRVISETLHSDGVREEVLLERRLEAKTAADAATFLYFQPQVEDSGAGLLDSVGAATSWVPVLLVDAESQHGDPFPIGDGDEGGDGGGFGDFGGFGGGDEAAPALLSLRLSVTREVPGQTPRESRRAIIDRVPATARAAGSIDGALPALPAGPGGPLVLGAVHQILVSAGGADPRVQAVERGRAATFAVNDLLPDDGFQDYAMSDVLWPVAVANQALVVASERAVVPAVDSLEGIRSFIGRPRVFVSSVGPGEGGPDAVVFQFDLLADGVSTIARAGADASGAPASQLWYGVLQSSLETEFGRALAGTLLPEGRRSVGVSQRMVQPLSVVEFGELRALADASPSLLAGLITGQLGVVPGDPLTAEAWWTVDPTTGAARAVVDPGLGGAVNSGGGSAGRHPRVTEPSDITSSGAPSMVRAVKSIVYDLTDKPKKIPPKERCPGNEYLLVVTCVSIPVYWLVVGALTVVVLACFMWGIILALKGIKRLVGAANYPLPRGRLLETKPA